jgi:hypothetical protein
MSLQRYFYISNDLDDLATLEQELKDNGIATPQIHILSQNDADVEHHKLNEVEAVLKKDVVHSMKKGAVIGIAFSAAMLALAYLAGWTASAAGWMPAIFLSVIILGFCTWEGGLFGIQEPHHQFKRFDKALKQGKHVFFVDINQQQEQTLNLLVKKHTSLKRAGKGEATPEWVVNWQTNWKGFVKSMP